jgi:hypothetical protein
MKGVFARLVAAAGFKPVVGTVATALRWVRFPSTPAFYASRPEKTAGLKSNRRKTFLLTLSLLPPSGLI